jgi:general stress protein 26
MSGIDLKTKEKAKQFLLEHPMAIVSTVGEDHKPHAAAIFYIVDEEFNFYFITRTETQKYKDMLAKPNSAFTVADVGSQLTIQGSGELNVVRNDALIETVYKKLARLRPLSDSDWLPPIIKLRKGHYVIIKFKPTWLRIADYLTQQKTSANYFTQLI